MQISKAYKEISDKLQTANLMQLTRTTGIAYNTLLAIKAGTANPTISTLEKLSAALEVA